MILKRIRRRRRETDKILRILCNEKYTQWVEIGVAFFSFSFHLSLSALLCSVCFSVVLLGKGYSKSNSISISDGRKGSEWTESKCKQMNECVRACMNAHSFVRSLARTKYEHPRARALTPVRMVYFCRSETRIWFLKHIIMYAVY